MEKAIIYTSNSCPYCTAAKDYFKQNNVDFEERNVAKAEYRKELMNLGILSVPVIKIGDELIKGFDLKAINNILGL
ncbi:MAG TPA: NrdH-redoxin [Clostridium sp.]|jgi:glutaredoxin|nr:glutaredoxin family protein [Clostridia bacterium]HCW05463.1 NrdH-redoxin [Clostridium sp.]